MYGYNLHSYIHDADGMHEDEFDLLPDVLRKEDDVFALRLQVFRPVRFSILFLCFNNLEPMY